MNAGHYSALLLSTDRYRFFTAQLRQKTSSMCRYTRSDATLRTPYLDNRVLCARYLHRAPPFCRYHLSLPDRQDLHDRLPPRASQSCDLLRTLRLPRAVASTAARTGDVGALWLGPRQHTAVQCTSDVVQTGDWSRSCRRRGHGPPTSVTPRFRNRLVQPCAMGRRGTGCGQACAKRAPSWMSHT